MDSNFRLLIIVSCCAMFAFSLFGLVQPLYLADLEMDATQFSLLFLISNIVSATLRLLIGWASDIYGRKWFGLAGLLFWTLAGVLLPISTSFEALLIPFVFWGAGAAFYFTVSGAFIADLTSPEKRAKAYSMIGLYNMVGNVLGPLIGGFVADIFGIGIPFFITAAAFLTSALAGLRLPNPQQSNIERRNLTDTLRGVTGAGVGRIVGVFILVYFIHGIYGSILWPLLPIFYKEVYHLDPSYIGIINTTFTIGMAIGFYLVSRLPETFELKKVLVYSMIPNALLLLTYLVAGSPLILLVAVFAHGITMSFNFLGPLGSTIFMRALPASARGIASGLTGTTWRLGMSLGSLVMGGVWASFGLIPIFYLSAALLFSEFIVLLVGLAEKRKSKEKK